MTPEEVQAWLDKRDKIQGISTPGRWTLSLPENNVEEVIIDSSECEGMWIATTDNEEYEIADGTSIVDAHYANPIMVKTLRDLLEQCDLMEGQFKYSEHEAVKEYARGVVWAAQSMREEITKTIEAETKDN